MPVTGLDHFVLTVGDIDRTREFYGAVDGVEVQTFGREGRTALHVGDQKVNLHERGEEFSPRARRATVGAGDFCLVTTTPVEKLAEEFAERGVDLVEGPVRKTGARGPMTSIYVRDPDGNLVEFSNYGEE